MARVPLAWLNLTHRKARFLLSIVGISFAVVLMFVQLGFWRALLDSQTAVVRSVDADLVLISAQMSTVTDVQSFPLERVQQARAVAGIAAARPLYVRYFPFVWKNRADYVDADPTGRVPQWPIRVLAFVPDTEYPAFREDRIPGFANVQHRLLEPGVALMDAKSKPMYDAIREWNDGGPSPVGVQREVAGQSLKVVGLFDLGTDFTTDGSLLMSARNLEHYAGPQSLDSVQIGLIKLEPGANSREVLAGLRRALPPDVRAMSLNELADQEEQFWSSSTPIGFIFMLGLLVGFVVGVVICYQILSTEVADHLAEFATLKAIGYHDRYIAGVVLKEALLLSLLGFGAGLAIGWPLYIVLEGATGLPLRVTVPRAGLILGLTVFMCVLSGFLALRRVRTADPAEVFG